MGNHSNQGRQTKCSTLPMIVQVGIFERFTQNNNFRSFYFRLKVQLSQIHFYLKTFIILRQHSRIFHNHNSEKNYIYIKNKNVKNACNTLYFNTETGLIRYGGSGLHSTLQIFILFFPKSIQVCSTYLFSLILCRISINFIANLCSLI